MEQYEDSELRRHISKKSHIITEGVETNPTVLNLTRMRRTRCKPHIILLLYFVETCYNEHGFCSWQRLLSWMHSYTRTVSQAAMLSILSTINEMGWSLHDEARYSVMSAIILVTRMLITFFMNWQTWRGSSCAVIVAKASWLICVFIEPVLEQKCCFSRP